MEKTKVIVGLGSCGIAAGANKTYEKINELRIAGKHKFKLKKTSCIGMCYNEPLVEIIDESGSYLYGGIDEKKAAEIIQSHITDKSPLKDYVVATKLFDASDNDFVESQVKITLRNCGFIDPENIDEYEARDGYRALKRIAGLNISRLDIIQTVLESGLRGRGGGGCRSIEERVVCEPRTLFKKGFAVGQMPPHIVGEKGPGGVQGKHRNDDPKAEQGYA